MIRKHARVLSAITTTLLMACTVAFAQTTSFEQLPGKGLDVGVGANGTAWMVGTDNQDYKWNGSSWVAGPGRGITRIAVDPLGNPWVLANGGAIYSFENGAYKTAPGQALDLGIGSEGSVYVVGLSNTLYRWTGSNWGASMGSDAAQIAVDPQGNPWTVSAKGQIARYVGGKKEVVAGQAIDIGIGKDGTVLVIGADAKTIWRWTGSGWEAVGGVAQANRIAVDPKGNPWIVTKDNNLWRGTPKVVNPPAPTSTGDARDDFNNLVLGFPRWSTFSPELADKNGATGASSKAVQQSGGTAFDCTTTPYTLTDTPDRIVTFNPDNNILWAGALLQGKGYKQGLGSLKELPIRQRAPLELSINLQTAQNSATVTNPNNVTVQTAIGGLIDNARVKGILPSSSISYQKVDSYSSEQVALALGISAKYLASSAKATLDFKRDVSQRTVSAVFRESAFTVSVASPQTPKSYLSSAFSMSDLNGQVQQGNLGSDNIPVYVSSITYGRILVFSMTSTASTQEINATLDALYEGGAVTVEGNLDAKYKKILRESTIKVVTIGGDTANTTNLIKSGKLSEYFGKTSLSTYKPISYEVRNLGDGSIAKISETTNYNVTECSVLTGQKIGERWATVVDGIYLDEPGDDSDGNIFGLGGLVGAKGNLFNIPRASAVTMKQGAVFGANRFVNVPGKGPIQGDGRFEEDGNFAVKDFYTSDQAGTELIIVLVDADYTLGNSDDGIIIRAEGNPIKIPNPYGSADGGGAPRITGTMGNPGSATVIYRQKKLCNLVLDPISKQIVPENGICLAAKTAISAP